MSAPDALLWSPAANWRDASLLGELSKRFGVPGYDELLALSQERTAAYWAAVIDHLGFRWRVPYTDFMQLPAGDPAFPDWFRGGRLNFVDTVFAHAEGDSAGRAAVIAEDEAGRVSALTYMALREQVLRFATGLREIGVERGDRVALMMPMGVEAVVTLLATAAIGAIAVPLFTGFGADAVAARLSLARARLLVAARSSQRRGRGTDLAPVLREARRSVPGLQLVVHGEMQGLECLAWASLATAPVLEGPTTVAPSTPFMVVFTSGTSGRPKGTVHTHAGFPLKILHDCAYHFDLRPGDRWLWPSDMGWIVGPITTAGALGRGATLVCYDGAPDHPGPGRLAEMIDRHQVTHFGASPTLVRSLAASGGPTEGAVLDSLRLLMVAGEVIDPEHFKWFFRQFGRDRLPVINYSGGTEASGALLANVPARPIHAGGFNSVSPGVRVFAADEHGKRLLGTPGELVVAAPFVGMTQGFWDDPERYLDAYWRERPGLWSHGDLLLEEEGRFHILGRSDDTLKIAGKRVGPAEVEALALEWPVVREAAAVSLPDPIKGEQLVMCVSTGGAAATGLPAAIARRVEQALGKPFRPAAIHVVDELPRTRNGKVMRRVIRNVLRGLPPGDLSALDNPGALERLLAAATLSA
jgi:acetyl-CoA synthetase